MKCIEVEEKDLGNDEQASGPVTETDHIPEDATTDSFLPINISNGKQTEEMLKMLQCDFTKLDLDMTDMCRIP